MKVIQNNYKNQPRNPYQLPEQTKLRVEKVKIKCGNCGSILEVSREDTHIGYLGLPYVTCPCCNYEMDVEEFEDDAIDICASNVKYPTHFTVSSKEFKAIEISDEEINFKLDINKPETLKEAYDKGFLVKRSNIFHGSIESEITKDGWRIHKGYPQDWGINRTPNHTTVTCSKVYRTYDEAQNEVDEHIAEYKRQAALSDYDWSIEQIDKVLGYYKNIYDLTDSEVRQYRDWILSQDDIENIELRIHFGNLEWRDWERHKKWHGIETNM